MLDRGIWLPTVAKIDKFEGDILPSSATPDGVWARSAHKGLKIKRFEHVEVEHNLLLIGGASIQWQTLIGNGTATAAQELTYYNNANAALGVGDSSTAPADTQTELQAATNHLRVGMDATYPLHTDSESTAGAKSINFRSTFSTAQANYAWLEWILKNTTTSGTTGRTLNRANPNLGTKTSAATWVFTVTLSLA